MSVSEVLSVAEELLEEHRQALFMDPFIKIELGVLFDNHKASECVKSDTSPLSWVIKLNIEKHQDMYDIHYSIFEGLLNILFSDIKNDLSGSQAGEAQKGIVSRLATTLSYMCDDYEEDDGDEYIYDEEVDEEDY